MFWLRNKKNIVLLRTHNIHCTLSCFSYFDSYRVADYARSGTVASQTVVLEAGPLPEFSHSMEPQLRQLGLPAALKKGIYP